MQRLHEESFTLLQHRYVLADRPQTGELFRTTIDSRLQLVVQLLYFIAFGLDGMEGCFQLARPSMFGVIHGCISVEVQRLLRLHYHLQSHLRTNCRECGEGEC